METTKEAKMKFGDCNRRGCAGMRAVRRVRTRSEQCGERAKKTGARMARTATAWTQRKAAEAQVALGQLMKSERGQGTTEYAILVGVLVVIAIIAIVLFRPKLEELWNAIADNMANL